MGLEGPSRRDVRLEPVAILLRHERQERASQEVFAGLAEVPAIGVAHEGQGSVGKPAGDKPLILGDRAMSRLERPRTRGA